MQVRATPVGPDGRLGPPQTASTEASVSVAPEVPHKLREWVQRGERKFDGLTDPASEKERAILFTGGRVKLREVRIYI